MAYFPLSKQWALLAILALAMVHQTTSQKTRTWVVKEGGFRPYFTPEGQKYFDSLKTKPNTYSNKRSSIPGTRREIRCMSPSERNNFFNALKQMKRTMVGLYSEFDHLQVRHLPSESPAAHESPSFFAWHREFMVEAEKGVKKYCSNCMMPYWDNRLDARLGSDPANSVLFLDTMMGNARGPVTTGFAANWRSVGDDVCTSINTRLVRDMEYSVRSLFNESSLFNRSANDYTDLVYPWNKNAELKHNSVHTSFGYWSHMSSIQCSPQDPFFYLHHTFMDYMYEGVRQNLKNKKRLVYPQVDENLTMSAGYIRMDPFEVTNEFAAINDYYTRDVYKYETAPGDRPCRKDEDCCANGYKEFLWCTSSGKCVSKAKVGARVKAGYPANACYCSSGTPAVVSFVCKCQ